MKRQAFRVLLAIVLSVASASLIACGSSTKGLIPASDAGPLQNDFETVQSAAENGDGSCSTTEQALTKTNEDFSALPISVDAGLRNNLSQGIAALRTRALALCAQPLPQTKTDIETTPTQTTPTTAETTPTQTTPTTTETTPTTPVTPPPSEAPHGGTPAPGAGETPAPGAGEGGGTGVGEGAGDGEGGASAQEGGK